MRRLSPWLLWAEAGKFPIVVIHEQHANDMLTIRQVTTRLLKEQTKQAKQTHDGEFTLPDFKKIERLDELATAKLSEIVRHSTLKDRGWRGYDEREVAAARELLSQNGIER